MRFLFAGALLALVAAAAAAGSPPARLALVQASPVTIAGAGFQSGHAVTVSYVSGAQHGRRVVRASAQGGLRVVFQTLAFDRCRGATVRAGAAPVLLVLPCSTPGGKPTIGGTLGGFVRGSAFVPEEHVTVTGRASDSGPVTTNLAAATDGSFAVHLPMRRAPCSELFFLAVGSLGSTATATVTGPDCKSP